MKYVWKCQHCGGEVTISRPVSESDRPPDGTCPKCGKAEPGWEKVMQVPLTRWRYCDQ